MDLKFYAKNKQGKSLWVKRAILFIFSGILSFGSASAQILGTALDFDASKSNKIVIPNAPSLNISGAITIEAWINIKSTGGVNKQDVVCKSSKDVNNSYIFPRTEDRWNTLQFRLRINGRSDWSVLTVPFKNAPTSIANNTWHHVAATYDGATMSIYIDGVLKGSLQGQTGGITVNGNPLVMGGHTGYEGTEGEYFSGRLDEVRIWNRALSTCEIANNKNCELQGTEDGLNAYYKFNNGLVGMLNNLMGDSILVDKSIYHNDGVLKGFVLNGATSNWITNPNVGGNCTPFTPINATAGAASSTIAVGETLQLTASGGSSYSWSGPNGFTSTEQNPTITNAQLNASGIYTVVVTQNGCAASAAVTVTVALRAKALLFDGNNDMIRVPNSASLNSNVFTLEAWVKPQSNVPSIQNVLSKVRLAPDQGFIFPRTDDGWLNFSIWLSVNGQGVTISAPFPGLNNWAHVAATYDGFNVKLYLNGNLVATQALQGFTLSTADLTMGVQDGGYTQYYKGGLDEVRIWKRALTQCEIQNNLTCELNGANNGLASLNGLGAYYRFNQGLINAVNPGMTSLADSSGNGNNGVLSNFDLSGTASNWAAGGNVNNATCSVYQDLQINATSNGPVVEVGNTVQLFASGGTNWSWIGPNGFTSNQQNPTIPNATVTNSGIYTVTVQGSGGCNIVSSTKLAVAYKAYSLNFDGVNDEIKVPASASLNGINNSITMEAWIYPTSSAKPIQDVMCKSTSDINSGYIFPRTDNGWSSYVFYLNINNVWQTLSAPYPGLNQWHHVAATYDGYYMRIYLDGVLSASKEVYGTITQNTNDLILGQQPGFDEHFAGSVDDARIWNRALNQCEIINNLYCELHPLQRDGLVAYYKFNQGFDNVDNTNITTLVDSSVNANNGTLKNFALQGTTSNWVASYSASRTNSTCAYNELPNVTAFANASLFAPGSTIKLFANGGFEYHWDGPQAFHADTRNPTLTNAVPAMTGTYTVTAPFVKCTVTASTRVVVNQSGAISADGPLNFCPSGSVTLSSNFAGLTYQWFRNDSAIQGATTNTYRATVSGVYTLSLTTANDVLMSEPVTVTSVDNAAPVPSVSNLPTLNLSTPATITTAPTALDDCAGTIVATTQDPLSYLYEGTYTINWKYDDHNGHVVTQTQQVVVSLGVDYKPPVLTVPANISLTGDASICGAIANFAATATDNSPDPVTITYSQNPGTVFPVGVTAVQVTAKDATGNVATGTFTVTVSPTVVAPVTGNTTICAGATTTLSTITTGGSWSSNNTNVATVNPNTGVVTGVNGGTTTIVYTNACGATASTVVTVNATPATPVVSVSDNCGSSVLSVNNATGNLLWSTNQTSASITVTQAGDYSVTQTMNGCTSQTATATAAPKATPAAPVVTVVNNCGSSTLTASGFTGSLLWSNNATTTSITVTQAGNYSVTQTLNGCVSAATTATAAPASVPATPQVSVVDNCGSSVLTVSGVTGSVLWSNNATTSSITVFNAADYTVTQTVNGCTSLAATATAAPKATPAAPQVNVVDNCGSSILTAVGATGNLLWSNNATTSSITVTQAGNYTVTQTVSGCTSLPGSGSALPKLAPATPVVSVVNNCGSSTLTVNNAVGSLLWSNGATGSSITVAAAGTFSVTQTVAGCVSTAGAGTAAPIAFPTAPVVTVVDNCGNSVLTAAGNNLLWSTGETTGSITVTQPGTYTVTQTVNGCTSPAGAGIASVTGVSAPVIAGPASGSTVTQNPLLAALDFNVFVQNNAILGGSQTAGPVAVGGNFTLNGDYSVSNNSAGTFKVSNVPVTLVVGGKVIYQGGNGMNVNQNGYVKIGDATGSYVWYKDQNNAYSPIRITPNTSYDANPRINLQANSQQLNVSAANNPVFQGGLIDFAGAFTQLQGNATSISAMADNANLTNPNGAVIPHTGLPAQVKINLSTGVNVLNINASDLNNVQNFTYNNQPDASHILVINVNAPGTFNWNVWNSGGIGDNNTSYILYNFYNTTSLTVQGNGSVMGTLLAPFASINKSVSQNTTGQIVGKSFTQSSGTNTYNKFAGTITSGSTTVIAANSNNNRVANNSTCSYTVNGTEFNATATAACGTPVLTYTLTGATTGSGSSLAGITLNTGVTTVTWTATNGTLSTTYAFTVTVQANTPATPVVTVANNCGNTVLSTNATGSLVWSNGATTPSITVNNGGTYTVTQTVNGCASAAGSGLAAPLAIPATPVVSVANNCGNSILSTNATGSLLWSNGATTSSINAGDAGTYSVTQTVNGCTSLAGSGDAAPLAIPTAPVVTVVNNCGNSTLSTNATGSLLWSNGATTSSITVSSGTYSVVRTVNGCTSAAGFGTAVPVTVPATPVVTVANNCGNAVLSTDATGSLLWSNGATTSSITVNNNETYTVTQTVNGCSSAAGAGLAAPIAVPVAPVVNAVNNCGSSVLTTNAGGSLLWSNGATTSSITVGDAATYSVTQTVNGCTSLAGSGNASPLAIPAAPSVSVTNNCGSSILSTNASGSLLWSNGATTSSITVNSSNTYSVTTKVNGCTSAPTAVAVIVNTIPTVASIVGAASVVAGSNTSFTDVTTGGVWSSVNSAIASVSPSGVVTGVSAGSTTVNYTVTTAAGCSTTVSAPITVTPACTAPVVTASNITVNTLANATSCNSPVTYSVNSGSSAATLSYVFTGATTGSGSGTGSGAVFNVGVTTVKVTATNACGTNSASFTVTLKDGTAPVPVVSSLPAITGQCSVNLGVTASNNNNCGDDCFCCRYSCHCRTSSCTCRSYDYRNIISYLISYLYNYYYGNDDNHGCDSDDDNNTSSNSNAPKATDNCKGTIVATTTDPLIYNSQGTYTIHWKYDDGNGNITVQEQTVIVKDDTKPVINVPSNITLNCGGSTTTSACGSATGTDNCSNVSISYTDAPNAAGTQILRTWKATDATGNFSTGVQTITIVDNTKPTITDVADVTVSCNGSTDPSATGRPAATDCSAVTVTYSDATSGNVITRTWRATDVFGNYNTSSQKITVGSSFTVDVSSVPTSNTYTGGISTNLYLGYGAQSTTLQTCSLPSSGAPYTYVWNGNAANRLNSTSSAAPVFSPNTNGSFTFTVTVTNKYGCTSTDYITICVTDIRVPGSNGKKVYVCHQTNSKTNPTQTIEVSINAVPAHLGDGSSNGCGNKSTVDRLGSCDQAPCGSTAVNSIVSAGTQTQTVTPEGGVLVSNQKSTGAEEEIKVTVLPNPSTTYFTLKFESKSNLPINLRVMDGNGRIVDARSAIVPNTSLQIGHSYSSGSYYAEVIQGGQRKVVQLIKARG